MKVILATGGSGGHIFPAITIARRLREAGCEIMFLGPLKKVEQKIKDQGFNMMHLETRGFTTDSIVKCLTSVIYMGKAMVQSYQYLKRFRPNIVIGFGGYGAFAPVVSAVALRYSVLIHEQNVVPGRANRLLSKLVDRIAISFEESEKYFNKEKTVLTGCPIHLDLSKRSKQEVLKKFNLREGLPVILVLGGSQGSHRINEEFLNTIEDLKRDLDFQVIHITGEYDFESTKERYACLNIFHYVTGFLDEINEAYAIADLVVSRAGAVTVSEISLFNIPSVLIPYPFAGGHQKENAKVLQKLGSARIIDESNLSAQKLKNEIIDLIGTEMKHEQIHKHVNAFPIADADTRLAKEIMELGK